jgi:hypothetical protein
MRPGHYEFGHQAHTADQLTRGRTASLVLCYSRMVCIDVPILTWLPTRCD